MVRLIFLVCITAFAACESNQLLKDSITLNYPSASAIENYDGRFYIMGDDATQMLVLDSSLSASDSVMFFPGEETRISKTIKPDIEGITNIYAAKETILLMIGSGSLSPYRNSAYTFHYRTRQVDSLRLDSFYSDLRQLGLRELNIEGVTSFQNGIALANRGHLEYPVNHLVLTTFAAMSGRSKGPIQLVRLGGNDDTTVFRGVSGLAYSRKSDRLLLSISTEATTNAFDDGAIGKSYLWIVRNFTAKRNWKAINPDDVIDLEEIDPAFRGHKIESVCIEKETGDFMHLILVADNDDGKSSVFRVLIEK